MAAALQARLFRADPEAAEGRWIAETRERRPHRLGTRDSVFSLGAAFGFVVFSVVAAILIDSHRSASPLVIATIVGVYALASAVEVPGVAQAFGCRPIGPVGWGIGLGAAGLGTAAAWLAPRYLPAPGPAGR